LGEHFISNTTSPYNELRNISKKNNVNDLEDYNVMTDYSVDHNS